MELSTRGAGTQAEPSTTGSRHSHWPDGWDLSEKAIADVVLQIDLGQLAGRMGDEGEAKRRFERTLGIARQQGHPLTFSEALLEYADYLLQLGDFIQAEGIYREVLDALPESFPSHRARILSGQARVQAGLGTYEQARLLGEESLELARSMHASDLEEAIEQWLHARPKKHTESAAGDCPVG
jgi:tetratricopeptide (TPR) repeat protein